MFLVHFVRISSGRISSHEYPALHNSWRSILNSMVHGARRPMGSHICATLARHPLFERFVRSATISLCLKEILSRTLFHLWPRKSVRSSSDWLTFLLLECHVLTWNCPVERMASISLVTFLHLDSFSLEPPISST